MSHQLTKTPKLTEQDAKMLKRLTQKLGSVQAAWSKWYELNKVKPVTVKYQ